MNKLILFVILTVMMAWSAQATHSAAQHRIATLLGKTELDSTYQELFDAFLEGAEVDDIVENSTACVHNLEQAYADISEALVHFAQRGWSWENYLDFTGALGDITPVIRTCYNATEDSMDDIREHFGQFDSFVDFADQAKNNAVAHFMDWYDIYSKISTAIDKKKDKDVSFQVGRGLRLLLDFTPRLSEEGIYRGGVPQLPDLLPFQLFLKGFLNGTRILSSNMVKLCVNETEFMVVSINNATHEFQKGTDESFKAAIFELGDMFAHLKDLNEDCYNGATEIKDTVMKYIKTFGSWLDIGINIVRHMSEISKDALGAYQDCRNGEWRSCGQEAGEIFFMAFFDH